MRVVIAEDQTLLREGLSRLFENGGHEVVAAVDNADRLRAGVAEHEPDLAVVDIRMPPRRAANESTANLRTASSVVSTVNASQCGLPIARSASDALASPASSRSSSAMRQCRVARSSAAARPSPLAPPVITARFSGNRVSSAARDMGFDFSQAGNRPDPRGPGSCKCKSQALMGASFCATTPRTMPAIRCIQMPSICHQAQILFGRLKTPQ